MLLFQKRFHSGIVDGSVTVTFRQWERPHVRVGGRYRVHPLGVVEVDKVAQVALRDLEAADARAAGFESLQDLHDYLRALGKTQLTPKSLLWRVQFHHGGDGDRVELALVSKLSSSDVENIIARLAKLDRDSPWTSETLAIIAKHPKVAASQLALKLGREKLELKEDIRKLKRLGLTESFEVGYAISPRGKAFLRAMTRRKR